MQGLGKTKGLRLRDTSSIIETLPDPPVLPCLARHSTLNPMTINKLPNELVTAPQPSFPRSLGSHDLSMEQITSRAPTKRGSAWAPLGAAARHAYDAPSAILRAIES